MTMMKFGSRCRGVTLEASAETPQMNGRLRRQWMMNTTNKRHKTGGSFTCSYFICQGSRDFDSRDRLSRVRIFGGNTDVALLNLVVSGDFDSRAWFYKERISGGNMNIVFFLSAGSRDFDSKGRLSEVRISRGNTYIVFFYSRSDDFDSREWLSGVRISGGSINIVFFFYSARSEDFDSREWLSRVRISDGSTNIAFFQLTEYEDIDSRERLSGMRISRGSINVASYGMCTTLYRGFFNLLRSFLLSESSFLKFRNEELAEGNGDSNRRRISRWFSDGEEELRLRVGGLPRTGPKQATITNMDKTSGLWSQTRDCSRDWSKNVLVSGVANIAVESF
ncbi:hypothetical protein TIFTF001_035057 [Ficus carica]|uniref:Uncharacterized protein n=1 Tax=Ficus carica TaxID=3494 RepID=A0AA88E1J0_FICCA|nr:hypothetical protein TIFTF001_035057 [Ficus carica]